jgi:hypothetical protein
VGILLLVGATWLASLEEIKAIADLALTVINNELVSIIERF